MNWITELIDRISISKLVAGGLSVATAFLLFSPCFLPGLFEPILGGYKVAAWFLLIYCSTILIIPLIGSLSAFMKKLSLYLCQLYKGRHLTDVEENLIIWLASKGNSTVNLHIEMQEMEGIKKIESLKIMKSLAGKGYIKISSSDETIVWLTSKGRDKALTLHERKSEKA